MIEFTRFRSSRPKTIAKTIALGESQHLVKTPGGLMSAGRFETVGVSSLAEFAEEISASETNNAFAYGLCSKQPSGRITTKARQSVGKGHPDALTRTRENFEWWPGKTILMFDFDPPSQLSDEEMDENAKRYTPQEARNLLSVVFREGVDMLLCHTSSSWIFNNDEELIGQAGLRIYVIVDDGTDIPRAVEVLRDRLWLEGTGYYRLTTNGRLLERCAVDLAVYQPERLDFVSGASVVPPLEQRRPPPEFFEGDLPTLDTKLLVTSENEKAEAEQMRKQARQEHEERNGPLIVRLAENAAHDRGISTWELMELIDQGGAIQPCFKIDLGKNKFVLAKDVSANPHDWHKKTMPDPLEPNYHNGSQKAIIYTLDENGRPLNQGMIISQAHGGYKLRLPLRQGVIDEPIALMRVAAASLADEWLGLRQWDPNKKRWLNWTSKGWQSDGGRLARNAIGDRLVQIAWDQVTEDAPVKQLDTRANICSVEELAKDLVEQTCASDWDQSASLLGVPGGVVDLERGILREEQPQDRVTLRTGIVPEFQCSTPRFDRFLGQITQGDDELQRFLWRLSGYLLTGFCDEQVFPFFFGEGADGKSVLLGLWQEIMGNYAVSLMSRTLVEDRFGGNSETFDLMRLRGKRFALAVETPKNARWNEALIKQITGGDIISARYSRANPEDFKATAKIVVASNYPPALREASPSMRRRLLMVRFGMALPKPMQDKRLKEKLLVSEGSAILGRMIEESKVWLNSGDLLIPQTVEADTREYFEEEDILGQFIEDYFVVKEDARAECSKIWALYQVFADVNGLSVAERAQSQKALMQELGRRGFPRQKSGSVRFRRRLEIRKSRTAESHPGTGYTSFEPL